MGADQAELDLGLEPAGGGPLAIADIPDGPPARWPGDEGPQLIMTPEGRALMSINGEELIWL